MTRVLILIVPFVCLLAGCGRKLNIEKDVDLSKSGQIFTIDAAGSEQTIKVSVTAEGAPVDVFVYLAKDRDDVEANINSPRAAILKKEMMKENIELEVTVPAKEEAVVHVQRSGKAPTSCKLKITN